MQLCYASVWHLQCEPIMVAALVLFRVADSAVIHWLLRVGFECDSDVWLTVWIETEARSTLNDTIQHLLQPHFTMHFVCCTFIEMLCTFISYCHQHTTSWHSTAKAFTSQLLITMLRKPSQKACSEILLQAFLKASKAHAKCVHWQVLCEKQNLQIAVSAGRELWLWVSCVKHVARLVSDLLGT